MVIVSSGEDVGSRDPHFGEPGTVGTAPDRSDHGLGSRLAYSFGEFFEHRRVLIQFFFHIQVLFFYIKLYLTEGELRFHRRGEGLYRADPLLHALGREIPKENIHRSLLHGSLNLYGAVVTVPVVGGFGALGAGEHGNEEAGHGSGVGQLSPSGADMDDLSGKFGPYLVGVETFGFDFRRLAAVEGITGAGFRLFKRKQVHSFTGLLIGGEKNLQRAMLDFRVVYEPFEGRHDFGEPRLVVGSEKRTAVGDDDAVARVFRQIRVIGGVEHSFRGEFDGFAVVALDKAGSHIRAGDVACGVHVSHEADHRLFLQTGRSRQPCQDVAVVVQDDVGNAQGVQFVHQKVGEVPLGFRRGDFLDMSIALGVDFRVTKESVQQAGNVGL